MRHISGKEGEEPLPSKSGKDLLHQHKQQLSRQQQQQRQQRDLLAAVPTIGRGLKAGQEVALDIPVTKKGKVAAEFAKVTREL